MRASEISTSSREDTSPERTIAASSVAGRNIRSLSVTALLLVGPQRSLPGEFLRRYEPAHKAAGSISVQSSGIDSQPVISSLKASAHERGHDTVASRPSPSNEVQSGLEGVVAFATEIAEPDRAGGSLRYRGVDIEDLVGTVPYEQVWGLLVDGRFKPGLPPAEPTC